MQVIAVLLVCLAAANAFYVPATTLVRAPAHDSAIIKSIHVAMSPSLPFNASLPRSESPTPLLPPLTLVSHIYAGYPYAAQYVAPAAVDAKAGQPLLVA